MYFSKMKSLSLAVTVMFSASFLPLFAIISTYLIVAPVATAQSSKGIVVGTVTDPAGAGVSGSTVRITNTSTNVSRETNSTADGSFRFDAVDPGTYKVEVTAAGFKTAERDNVIIAAAQTADTSFTLEVGGASEVVNVTTEGNVILQKQDGTRTSTLDRRQIVDLPVAGLNPVNLVFTLPGVTAPGVLAGGFVQGRSFPSTGCALALTTS